MYKKNNLTEIVDRIKKIFNILDENRKIRHTLIADEIDKMKQKDKFVNITKTDNSLISLEFYSCDEALGGLVELRKVVSDLTTIRRFDLNSGCMSCSNIGFGDKVIYSSETFISPTYVDDLHITLRDTCDKYPIILYPEKVKNITRKFETVYIEYENEMNKISLEFTNEVDAVYGVKKLETAIQYVRDILGEDKAIIHVQRVPSRVWLVEVKHPRTLASVTIYDTMNKKVQAVHYIKNEGKLIEIRFNVELAGRAYIL